MSCSFLLSYLKSTFLITHLLLVMIQAWKSFLQKVINNFTNLNRYIHTYYDFRHCLDLCWAKICEVIESCETLGKPDSCVTNVLSAPDYMTCENMEPWKILCPRKSSRVLCALCNTTIFQIMWQTMSALQTILRYAILQYYLPKYLPQLFPFS